MDITSIYRKNGFIKPSPFSWRKALARFGYKAGEEIPLGSGEAPISYPGTGRRIGRRGTPVSVENRPLKETVEPPTPEQPPSSERTGPTSEELLRGSETPPPRKITGTKPRGFEVRPVREVEEISTPTPEELTAAFQRSHPKTYQQMRQIHQAYQEEQDPARKEELLQSLQLRIQQQKTWEKNELEKYRKPEERQVTGLEHEAETFRDETPEQLEQRYRTAYPEKMQQQEDLYKQWIKLAAVNPNDPKIGPIWDKWANLYNDQRSWEYRQREEHAKANENVVTGTQAELDEIKKKRPMTPKQAAAAELRRIKDEKISRGDYTKTKAEMSPEELKETVENYLGEQDATEYNPKTGKREAQIKDPKTGEVRKVGKENQLEVYSESKRRYEEAKQIVRRLANILFPENIHNLPDSKLLKTKDGIFLRLGQGKDQEEVQRFLYWKNKALMFRVKYEGLENLAVEKKDMMTTGEIFAYHGLSPDTHPSQITKEMVREARAMRRQVDKTMDKTITTQADSILTEALQEAIDAGKFDNPEILRQAKSIVENNRILEIPVEGRGELEGKNYVPFGPLEGGYSIGRRLYAYAYRFLTNGEKPRYGQKPPIAGETGTAEESRRLRRQSQSHLMAKKVDKAKLDTLAQAAASYLWEKVFFVGLGLSMGGDEEDVPEESRDKKWSDLGEERNLYYLLFGESMNAVTKAAQQMKKGDYQGRAHRLFLFSDLATESEEGKELSFEEQLATQEQGKEVQLTPEQIEEQQNKVGDALIRLDSLATKVKNPTAGRSSAPETRTLPTVAALIFPYLEPKEYATVNRTRDFRANPQFGMMIQKAARQKMDDIRSGKDENPPPEDIQKQLKKLASTLKGNQANEILKKRILWKMKAAGDKLNRVAEQLGIDIDPVVNIDPLRVDPAKLSSINFRSRLPEFSRRLAESGIHSGQPSGVPGAAALRQLLDLQEELKDVVQQTSFVDSYRWKVSNYIRMIASEVSGDHSTASRIASKRNNIEYSGLSALLNLYRKYNRPIENPEGKSLSRTRYKKHILCPDGTPMSPRTRTCSGREGWLPYYEEEDRRSDTVFPKGGDQQYGPMRNKSFTIRPSPFGRKRA